MSFLLKEVTLGSLKKVGLTESQIKDLLFQTGCQDDRVFKIRLRPQSAKAGFGIVPPNKSTVRSREDCLYLLS